MSRAPARRRAATAVVALAAAGAALAAGLARAQVEQLDKRRLDAAEAGALAAWLQPRAAGDGLDLATLQSQAIRYLPRGRARPAPGWRLLANAWSRPALNAQGLCTSDDFRFEAAGADGRWKPGAPARVRYVWLATAPACARVAHPVGVERGLDDAQVAAVVRQAEPLRRRAAGLFGPRLAREGCGVDLGKLDLDWIGPAPLAAAGLEPAADGPRPPALALVYAAPGNDLQQIQVTARFGPDGLEPGEAGCQGS